VAVVTGASRGIGRAIARELAGQGARVAVNYARDEGAAEAVVAEIAAGGGEAESIRADVSRADEVERLFATIEARWGPARILVNNAGIDHEATLDELTEADWQRVLAVNLTGPFLCLRRAVRTMPAGGAVV
jgi:NAD(P)-dependent dehydrogenase (short-subunit alcohol dehydrogenase family)